jgi:hypothetical protein
MEAEHSVGEERGDGIADRAGMRRDRLTLTALGGIAGLLLGIALLLEDERSLFARVVAMVGGFAALVMANHERLKPRVDALEKRLAQRDWRERAEVRSDR